MCASQSSFQTGNFIARLIGTVLGHFKWILIFLMLGSLGNPGPVWAGATLSIAAASDLKPALEEVIAGFRALHPEATFEVNYGSSGKFYTQIQQGAPFDLFFSADITLPRNLVDQGLAGGPVRPYAIGRLVVWSSVRDVSTWSLQNLVDPTLGKIAMANPRHAPYGRRAEEALRAVGVWDAVQERLVLGENIAQTAQFAESGNAAVGIIALSLALDPVMAGAGSYALIKPGLHAPLEQGFIITQQGVGKPLVQEFAVFMTSPHARDILGRFGFDLPAGSEASCEGGRAGDHD